MIYTITMYYDGAEPIEIEVESINIANALLMAKKKIKESHNYIKDADAFEYTIDDVIETDSSYEEIISSVMSLVKENLKEDIEESYLKDSIIDLLSDRIYFDELTNEEIIRDVTSIAKFLKKLKSIC